MPDKYPDLKTRIPGSVRQVCLRLKEEGYRVYLVGGCVRDTLLGLSPHDWDLTTDATAEQMRGVLSDYRTVDTGIRHGTLTCLSDGMPVEITTYRSSRGKTVPLRLEDDLVCRDLTVNAIAYSEEEGFIDPTGGLADLERRILRAPGNPSDRFDEDGLRVLRVARFAAQTGFAIEEKTYREAVRCAPYLKQIAAERIFAEFSKTILGDSFEQVANRFGALWSLIVPGSFLALQTAACAQAVSHAPKNLPVRLALVLQDGVRGYPVPPFSPGALMKQLRLDHVTSGRVKKIIGFPYADLRAQKECIHHLILDQGPDVFLDAVAYQYAQGFSARDRKDRALDNLEQRRDAILQCYGELKSEGAVFSLSDLAVNGLDLMASGFAAGPAIGDMLGTLAHAVADRRVPNEKQALLSYAASLGTKEKE